MAPSSKSEKDNKQKTLKKHKDHVVKLLMRGKLSGQYSQRLFRKLPPRVCVPLKNIVSSEFLRAGHIFLGFTKCGRYVLSYTRDYGEDFDFSFYTYHLYWWEFNLHSRLKQVHHVQLFAGEEIYSDLYLTVCEWPNDQSKIVIFGFNTRSSSSALMNLMISDENNRDIYITIASMPPPKPCSYCSPNPSATTIRTGSGECLEHGYVLNSRYQVVYPFPTFQPAFQLKKDQVILLNTSYSLVACAVSLCPGKQGQSSQILYAKGAAQSTQASTSFSSTSLVSSSLPQGSPENRQVPSRPPPIPSSPNPSQAALRAREFAADLFRRAQGAGGKTSEEQVERTVSGDEKEARNKPEDKGIIVEASGDVRDYKESSAGGDQTSSPQMPTASHRSHAFPHFFSEQALSPASSPLSLPSTSIQSSCQDVGPNEPGYVNYSRLHYRLQQPGAAEQNAGGAAGYEDDKVQLHFTVKDLKGRNLQLVTEPHNEQSVCIEQLTLDFEYLINEVIRRDAAWAPQFCSFSDYDVVILEVCSETNIVMINIGLLLLAFSVSDDEHRRPNTYHSNLLVSWDLSTGACCTVGVGDLTEVKGQTSGSVWSSYRKSCVNMVMKWLLPENSSRYIHRMTNEALHKGSSLQVLADSDRCTWIVL